jgi:hypothetical protein
MNRHAMLPINNTPLGKFDIPEQSLPGFRHAFLLLITPVNVSGGLAKKKSQLNKRKIDPQKV